MVAARRPPMAALLVLALALTGCPGPSEDRDAPVIDVPPAVDVDTTNDPQAGEAPSVLVGILPSDFPDDLPLYLPASLVDFGQTAGGLRSVSLLSPHRDQRVRQELEGLLAEQGWSVEPLANGSIRVRKGSKQVWLRVQNARPGTLYAYDY